MSILNTKLHPAINAFAIVVAFVVAFGTGCLHGDQNANSEPLATEENMDETVNTIGETVNPTVAGVPAIDAKQPTTFDTATFAVG